MGGLSGWSGTVPGVLGPAARGLPGTAQLPGAGQAQGSRTDAARGLQAAGGIAASPDGTVWAGVSGAPRWADRDLAELAADRGDAAALLEAYRRHGEGLFRRLRGGYAVVVLDARHERVVAGIDRFGIQPLCYATPSKGGVVFGSTTDDVRAHPAVTSTVSPQALYGFLHSYAVRAPATIYVEQRKLCPAEYLVHERGRLRLGVHWQPSWGEDRHDEAELAEELRRRLRAAVVRSLGRESAASFLSGGLDSSTVTGFAAAVAGRPARAFTVGFEDPRYDERPYARIAARHFGVELVETVLTPQRAAALLPEVAAAFDEPFGNSSALPTLLCARSARAAGVGLMLAGDGGDEIFAGNARYREQLRYEAVARMPAVLNRALLGGALSPGLPWGGMPPVYRARRFLERAGLHTAERLEVYNPLAGRPVAQVLDPDLALAVDPELPVMEARALYDAPSGASSVQRMMHLDLTVTLADNDLRKVGRMCELAGVRVAYPMLDEDLVDFAVRIPGHLQATPFALRRFFRRALEGFLPDATLAKRKHGFGMPFGPWTTQGGELADMAAESLRSLAGRGFLNRGFVGKALAAVRGRGDPDLGGSVWDLMMLELWLRSRAGIVRDAPSAEAVA